MELSFSAVYRDYLTIDVDLFVKGGKMKRLSIALLCGAVSACSFVKVSDDGKSVELQPDMAAVSGCQDMGIATAQVMSKIIFKREKESMAKELADLARNQAAEMGGDTIVPTSEIVDGKQRFAVFKCK